MGMYGNCMCVCLCVCNNNKERRRGYEVARELGGMGGVVIKRV